MILPPLVFPGKAMSVYWVLLRYKFKDSTRQRGLAESSALDFYCQSENESQKSFVVWATEENQSLKY